jgi:DNA-binding NtrC family response regulator
MSRSDDTTRREYHNGSLFGGPVRRAWCLTLAFHPDPRRIGAQCRIPLDTGALNLGRSVPAFNDPQGDAASGRARPVEDPCVSRQALTLVPQPDGWQLRRRRGSSRLRLEGQPVADSVRLSDQTLEQGVLLLLAGRVLIHLRLAPALDDAILETPPVPGLLGVSDATRRLRRDILRVAQGDDDVLLLGPTGTGKDVAARAIHTLSSRAPKPFIAVNMGALVPQLAAAELFGARRGAFTGAGDHRRGFFQQAAGGTLFLDEIGDTPPEVQPLLLRAVQSREVQVVGGAVERPDLRLLAATERDPDEPGSSFRAALRHRLAAQELRLKSLAERREDVGPLLAASLHALSGDQGFPWDGGVPGDAQRWALCFEWLHRYQWPGNVRELQQWAAQIAAASRERCEIPELLQQRLAGLAAPEGAADAIRETDAVVPLRALSDEAFIASWQRSDFEVARMARTHGASRQAVYRRLRELEQCRLAGDVPLGELLAVLDECRGDLRATARRLAVSHSGLRTRLRASGVSLDTPSAESDTRA